MRPTRQQQAAPGQPAVASEAAATEIDILLAEIDGLEQGMLGLRLQQQEADAKLRQINELIQQQAGGLATAQRLLRTFQGLAGNRQGEPSAPAPAEDMTEGGAE